jgi:hypothetical protein
MVIDAIVNILCGALSIRDGIVSANLMRHELCPF